ncbi:g10596 [Coccomyxa viridis]|uniref:G10596 protein n=1 Tax=Coccomyxa viridis TaxID=1274662 RepID=A0ABP1G8H3_9CHLO
MFAVLVLLTHRSATGAGGHNGPSMESLYSRLGCEGVMVMGGECVQAAYPLSGKLSCSLHLLDALAHTTVLQQAQTSLLCG